MSYVVSCGWLVYLLLSKHGQYDGQCFIQGEGGGGGGGGALGSPPTQTHFFTQTFIIE